VASIGSAYKQLRPPLGLRRLLARCWRWVKDSYLAIGISAALLWVVGVPLLSVITFSFRDGTPIAPGQLTLQNYRDAYLNPQTGPALLNTVAYAVVVSVVSLAMATLFAWLVERTDMPGRNFAWVMMLLPIAMPGMLASMAWILLLSDNTGLINVVARGALSLVGVDLDSGPFNIYTLEGMIFVEGVRGSTTLFLMMVAAFRLMDPSLEEAARISGARTGYTFRKVTLRLMLPAILAAGTYALIGNLDDLETPLLIGLPAGIFLLPTLIYFTASEQAQWGLSAAYTTIFMLFTVAMVVIYYRVVVRKASRFAIVTGKAYRPRRTTLGRWRYPALGLFVVYFAVTIALPTLVLIWASLLPVYELPSFEALGKLSLDNYAALFQQRQIVRAVWNTGVLGGATATATMGLAFLVAWLVVRQRVKGGVGLDAVGFIPHAIPSVAVGVALISFYLNPWLRWTGVYGTMAILVLALMTRYMAFATRTSNSSMTQLGKELEEVAYVSGVGRARALVSITFRLLAPAFLAGWIWVAAHAVRNLSIPLMLSTSRNETIATTLYFYWQRKADFSLASALGVAFLLVLSLVAIVGRRLISSGYSEDG
jgi:iron(III) transport system permease protein